MSRKHHFQEVTKNFPLRQLIRHASLRYITLTLYQQFPAGLHWQVVLESTVFSKGTAARLIFVNNNI